MVKTSHHAVFDEAWYLQPSRPPAAQLLYDMGMEVDTEADHAPPAKPKSKAPWPEIVEKPLTAIRAKAKNVPIPLRMSATPTKLETMTRAAKLEMGELYWGTMLHPSIGKTKLNPPDVITEMNLDKRETFEQVYVSPIPYADAFEETIDILRWTWDVRHQTAGM